MSSLEVEWLPLKVTDNDSDDDQFYDDYPHDHDLTKHTPVLPTSSSLSQRFHDWMYPPNVPRACQLWRRENLAIPLCYVLVGTLQGLMGPLINVYPLDLGTTEAQQITLSSIRSLPATFKLLFGFLSDTVPVCGYRRKSYMLCGWLVFVLRIKL